MSTNPLRAAYAHNREALQRETEETHAILQRTIQAQQSSSEALRDENALLRAQLEQAERRAAQAEASLQAERVASAAIARQNTSVQGECAQLRKRDALLQRIMTTFAVLEALGPETWPKNAGSSNASPDTQAVMLDFYNCKKEKVHWEPLIAELRMAEQQFFSLNPSGPNGIARSNPITIPPRR